MKVNVYAKDLTVTKDEENKISEKLSFLDKYLLIDSETTAQVVVKKHGNDIKLEITIPSKVGSLRSEVVDHALRNAIDESIDKLEDQVRRQKTRLNRRHKEKLAKTFIDENDYEMADETITKTKRIVVDDLDVDDAIMQMELGDHDFFLFRDKDTKLISVIYTRKDGSYGVIEVV